MRRNRKNHGFPSNPWHNSPEGWELDSLQNTLTIWMDDVEMTATIPFHNEIRVERVALRLEEAAHCVRSVLESRRDWR